MTKWIWPIAMNKTKKFTPTNSNCWTWPKKITSLKFWNQWYFEFLEYFDDVKEMYYSMICMRCYYLVSNYLFHRTNSSQALALPLKQAYTLSCYVLILLTTQGTYVARRIFLEKTFFRLNTFHLCFVLLVVSIGLFWFCFMLFSHRGV